MALAVQLRQRQTHAVTPAMMVELSLLQLPIGELREAVKKELDSNPALEVEREYAVSASRAGRSVSSTEANPLENVADSAGETLAEHLMSELRMCGVAARELDLCRAIVADLNSDGRFEGSIPDLQMVTGATPRELEAARQRVMTIDPKGCGARDLAECYRAQIGEMPPESRADVEQAITAIADAMSGGANKPLPKLSPAVQGLLKKLNPFPGRLYDYRRVEYVTPDIVVDSDGDVEVDQRDIPELRVSPKYVEMAKDKSLDEQTRQYAADRVKRAREFREALVRRQETMEKIAELAVGGQADFLSRGVAGLRKQTMSEVAKKAKCTVSTVSRAAVRKYVKTPIKTMRLRDFFVLVDQEPIVKLREILDSLPTDKKVSDQQVSEMMAKAGYKMARRTVAKYRTRFKAAR